MSDRDKLPLDPAAFDAVLMTGDDGTIPMVVPALMTDPSTAVNTACSRVVWISITYLEHHQVPSLPHPGQARCWGSTQTPLGLSAKRQVSGM